MQTFFYRLQNTEMVHDNKLIFQLENPTLRRIYDDYARTRVRESELSYKIATKWCKTVYMQRKHASILGVPIA